MGRATRWGLDAMPSGRVAMNTEVEQLQDAIVRRLERAGVRLPTAELAALSASLLAEAVRLSLSWLETGEVNAGRSGLQ